MTDLTSDIKAIQTHLGVPADGMVGPQTLAAIKAAIGMPAPMPTPAGAASVLGTGSLRPSVAAFSIIKEFEGYARRLPDGRCQAYPDPGSGGDPWTIGFGSTGPGIAKGVIWTRQQAEERLEADVIKFAAGVAKRIDGAATAQCEFDAMVSLAYNIGLGNFEKSTLLRKHKAGDKGGAAGEFVKWNRAAGRVMDGLTRRRVAEAVMYRGQA